MARKQEKQDRGERLLTDVELELMTLLWRIGEGTVHEVLAALPPERTLAYTTVSTMLRILEQKEVVTSRKAGRGHVYVPLLSKGAYEAMTVRHMVKHVFDGAPATLVRRLLEASELTPEELAVIRAMLDGASQS